jgi:hypothetical protein
MTLSTPNCTAAIQEFIGEMRLNIEQDVAMWRERMKGMRQQIKARIDGDEAARRRLLTQDSKETIKNYLAKVRTCSWRRDLRLPWEY